MLPLNPCPVDRARSTVGSNYTHVARRRYTKINYNVLVSRESRTQSDCMRIEQRMTISKHRETPPMARQVDGMELLKRLTEWSIINICVTSARDLLTC